MSTEVNSHIVFGVCLQNNGIALVGVRKFEKTQHYTILSTFCNKKVSFKQLNSELIKIVMMESDKIFSEYRNGIDKNFDVTIFHDDFSLISHSFPVEINYKDYNIFITPEKLKNDRGVMVTVPLIASGINDEKIKIAGENIEEKKNQISRTLNEAILENEIHDPFLMALHYSIGELLYREYTDQDLNLQHSTFNLAQYQTALMNSYL
ncbi:MAG: hypothetical protein AAF378_05090 [Cyanobacteria bacterium P01_A01_bin.84]